jgi:two-component system phosphate regulon sensor histidine kinase PhoR
MWSAPTTILIVVAFLMLVLLCVAVLMQARTRRSIDRLRDIAAELARGDLAQRVPEQGPRPVRTLARALNQMARQLQDRLSTVVRQRNEMGAVLSSMAEGVVAIDNDERILSLNAAAASMLRLDLTASLGRPIREAVRNTALHALIDQTLAKGRSVQVELTLRSHRGDDPFGGAERSLEVQSAMLRGEAGGYLGAVLVLHDVTRLRKLEAVRRDFVANVSHEVKTPVAAIKAAVETLIDTPDIDPTSADRFKRLIARQAERMEAIVEDLLSLARLEQGHASIRAELAPTAVAPLLAASVETCSPHAAERSIVVTTACEDGLVARVHPRLVEQALVNLIENAIKYSPPQTSVKVSARRVGGEVVIAVADQGRGIAPEHLPRVFERFYRTDRSRSRAMGGTGLGLSIVKHVAESHGGFVDVESSPRRGSTFRLHFSAVDDREPARADAVDTSSAASISRDEPTDLTKP